MRLPIFLFVSACAIATISPSSAMALPCKGLSIGDSKTPAYPLIARAARIQGTIRLRITLSSYGSITNVAVIDGPRLLQSAAVDYVKSWVFYEGSEIGACTQETNVEFKLTEPEEDQTSNFMKFTREDISHTTFELHLLKPLKQ